MQDETLLSQKIYRSFNNTNIAEKSFQPTEILRIERSGGGVYTKSNFGSKKSSITQKKSSFQMDHSHYNRPLKQTMIIINNKRKPGRAKGRSSSMSMSGKVKVAQMNQMELPMNVTSIAKESNYNESTIYGDYSVYSMYYISALNMVD